MRAVLRLCGRSAVFAAGWLLLLGPTYLPTYPPTTYPLTHLPTYSPNLSTLLPNPTLSLVGTSVRHDLGGLVSEQQMGQMDTLHTRLVCLVFLLE